MDKYVLTPYVFPSIAAISNIVGKLFTGWFSDLRQINSFLVYNVFLFLSGVSVLLFPFCTSFELYVVLVSAFGFFLSFVLLETIVLVEILGLENLTSAYGLIMLFQGLASIIGAPIAGWHYLFLVVIF